MSEFLDSFKCGHPYVSVCSDFVTLRFENQFVQSRMCRNDPDILELQYTKTMMGFLLAKPDPEHILMIGLGGGSLLKFCHRHFLDTRITVIEINPKVIALRDAFMIPNDDDRLNTICANGADFIASKNSKYDVILIDGFNALGQAEELTTLQFYKDCLDALEPKGLFVANLDADHPAHAVFVRRVEKVFKNNVVEVEVPDRTNRIVFAGKDLPISSRWMSLSWSLGKRTVQVQIQLKKELKRILNFLDSLDPASGWRDPPAALPRGKH
jgi:spermidine synthase